MKSIKVLALLSQACVFALAAMSQSAQAQYAYPGPYYQTGNFYCSLSISHSPIYRVDEFSFGLSLSYALPPAVTIYDPLYTPPFTVVFYGSKNGQPDIRGAPYPQGGRGYGNVTTGYNELTGFQNVPGTAGTYERYAVVVDAAYRPLCVTNVVTAVLRNAINPY